MQLHELDWKPIVSSGKIDFAEVCGARFWRVHRSSPGQYLYTVQPDALNRVSVLAAIGPVEAQCILYEILKEQNDESNSPRDPR